MKRKLDKNTKMQLSDKPLNPNLNLQSDVNLNDPDNVIMSKYTGQPSMPSTGPSAQADIGNSQPDDTHTGRFQTTTIKDSNPRQSQSPQVGALNDPDLQKTKDPLKAQYGKDHGNLGSKVSLGGLRGAKGMMPKSILNKPGGSKENK